eukprot:scpid109773/ scgid30270/ 
MRADLLVSVICIFSSQVVVDVPVPCFQALHTHAAALQYVHTCNSLHLAFSISYLPHCQYTVHNVYTVCVCKVTSSHSNFLTLVIGATHLFGYYDLLKYLSAFCLSSRAYVNMV